jgi:hypothetical protein
LLYLSQLRYDPRAGIVRPLIVRSSLMRIPVRAPICVAAIAALVLGAGCRKHEASEPPVVTPTLTLNKDRVPIGSAVTLTYKFQVLPNASFDKNYWVFVHVLDPEGEQMWTDDHLPPVPTSTWKPGQTVEYKRTVFVPSYPYIGPAVIRLGLYDPPSGRRLTLDAQEVSRREYLLTKFEVLPSSENVYLIYKDGWYAAESDAKNATSEWQWTKKAATLSFKNPKKDATLYLEYDARTDLFNPPQQVTLKLGDQVVGQFAADAKMPTLKTFSIQASQLGSGDVVDLSIGIDRIFLPGKGDPRELGIRVFHTYLEPK